MHSVSMHFVYVLESITTRKWYTGYTMNIDNRLEAHNRGKNISTAHGGPWRMIYYEACLHKMDALGREKFLKSGSGHRFIRKQLVHYFEDNV